MPPIQTRPVVSVLPMKSEREKDGSSPCSGRLSNDGLSHDGWEDAIEGEDDSSQCTDFETESDKSSKSDDLDFQRLKLRPVIHYRRSFLTAKLNEAEQENALVRAASNPERLLPTSSPSIVKSSPEGSQEIAISLAGVVDSAQKVRKSMLTKEMPESLRRDLVWERREKRTTVEAFKKRKGTAVDPQDSSFEIPEDYHGVGW
jgi:hypothetical protein